MRRGLVLLVALAIVGIGTAAAQAQCCGTLGYTTFYSAPAHSVGWGCGCAPCYTSCNSCFTPGYTTGYTSYYTPYYSNWGWGGLGWGRPWRAGYWGWRW